MNDWIILGDHKLLTLVAVSEEEQTAGLMHYSYPPPIMCFPYHKSAQRNFWMKDTPSPLDIVFCNNEKIVKITSGSPLSENYIGSDILSNLVVELPGGMAERLQLQPGMVAKVEYSLQTLAKRYKDALQA